MIVAIGSYKTILGEQASLPEVGTVSGEQPDPIDGHEFAIFIRPGDIVSAERDRGNLEIPASVPVPFVDADDSSHAGVTEYPLIQFPWEPWSLTAYMQLTLDRGGDWADWLNQAESDRVTVFTRLMEQIGAPGGSLLVEPDEWLAIGAWVYRWFPVVAEPFLHHGDRLQSRGFFQDQPEARLGSTWTPAIPSDPGYSIVGDVLLHSVTVDLALLIAGRARAVRASLRWQPVSSEELGDVFLTPDPSGSSFPLIRQVRDFLVQSVTRPRGHRGHKLRQFRSGELHRCYQRAASGEAQLSEWEQFPGSNEDREGCRYYFVSPRRADPEPPKEVTAAVVNFRHAGWFETTKLADVELARAALTTWRAYEGEDLPLDSGGLNSRLLVMDCGRTWSEDVDADARPHDYLHQRTLYAIGRMGGKAFAKLRDAEERWADPDGDVELSFWLGRLHHVLQIPSPRRYLSPALITGLNELLAADSARLWFVDSGPPIAIVTRATAAERDALENMTGLQLRPEPPEWWTSLAPLTRRSASMPPE